MKKKSRLGRDPIKEAVGVDALIQDTRKGKQSKQGSQGVQADKGKVITKTSQEGTKSGWTRATFIMREDYVEKIKSIAYWDRKEIKDVINEAIASYLKRKKIKPKPKGR